ncbi:gem-associated protein 7, partial [Passer montanus]|uniref:gem-associated protein 7 n=1 Tax=Passer montanus TaxID=9160 RepID=UPI001960997E
MADPIPVPVAILRLPRGPDSSGSRGFSREHRGRSRQDGPEGAPEGAPEDSRCPAALQRARALLRERFLRLLGRARGRRARFRLCTGLRLLGDFGAA